ncbi:MAG: hypothetical protein GX896_03380 [Clostridiales bacterium]|nr:hypothetical protein [Clostridiales bacterium]
MPSNKKMIELMYLQKENMPQEQIDKVQQYINTTVDNIVYQNECILLHSGLSEPMEFIHDNYVSLSSFENLTNQIDLNQVFQIESISSKFALYFFREFKKKIKEKFPDIQFCLTMVLENTSWHLRFHINRGEEGLLIDKNVKYSNKPLIYDIC